MHRDVFGYNNDQADAGVDGLYGGLFDRGRRYEEYGTLGAGLFDGFLTVLKTGTPSTICPPLPGVTPATTLVP
jgi:hypothetical protein